MAGDFGFELGARTVFLTQEAQCKGTPADSGLHTFKEIPATPIYAIFAHRRCKDCNLFSAEWLA